MGLLQRSGPYELHPEGVFELTLADVVLGEFPDFNDPAKMVQKLVWKFDTNAVGEDGRPLRESYFTTLSLNEKSNMVKVIKALGFDPADPYWDQIDSVEDLAPIFGTKCLGHITHTRKTDGTTRANITALMPLPSAAPVQAAARAAAPAGIPTTPPAAPAPAPAAKAAPAPAPSTAPTSPALVAAGPFRDEDE